MFLHFVLTYVKLIMYALFNPNQPSAGAYTSYLRTKAELHPGQVLSSPQGQFLLLGDSADHKQKHISCFKLKDPFNAKLALSMLSNSTCVSKSVNKLLRSKKRPTVTFA